MFTFPDDKGFGQHDFGITQQSGGSDSESEAPNGSGDDPTGGPGKTLLIVGIVLFLSIAAGIFYLIKKP